MKQLRHMVTPSYPSARRRSPSGRQSPSCLRSLPWRLPFLLLGGCLLLAAGALPATGQRLNIQTHLTDPGLPRSQILALHQDRDGYLWFGSYSGAGRYNGLGYRVFSSSDGLPGNVINALAEDARGRMVVSTGGGAVCTLERPGVRCFDSLGVHGVLGGADILHLAVDGEGNLWMGSSEGLAMADPEGAVRRVEAESGLPPGQVQALALHPDGSLWVATDRAIARKGRGAHRFQGVVDTAALDQLHAGTPLARGRGVGSGTSVVFLLPMDATNAGWPGADPEGGTGVLVGMEGGLAIVREGGELLPVEAGPLPPEVRFRGGTLDREGTGWFVTNAGLLRLDATGARWIREGQGLPWTDLGVVRVDHEGNVWVGSDLGLARLVPGPFVGYGEADGLPGAFLRALGRDAEGRIWAGTRQGVAVWEPDSGAGPPGEAGSPAPPPPVPHAAVGARGVPGGRFVPVILPESLPDPRVYALAQAPEGGMLVGTGDGLAHHRDGSLTLHGSGTARPGGWVGSLAPDPDGSIWVATRTGVGRWLDGGLQGLPEDHPMAQVFATRVLVDDRGRLWAGTHAGGVLIWDRGGTGEVVRLGGAEGLTDQVIWDLAPDTDGAVWVASNGDGVFRVPPWAGGAPPAEGIERLGTAQGLPDPFAWQVHVDRGGSLWVYTGRGLVRRSPEGAIRSYGVSDGLVALEGTAAAVLELEDGTLWFGTGEGAVVFDPSIPDQPRVAPRVRVEEVRVDGRVLSIPSEAPEGGGDARAIRFRSGILQVQVAALTFRNPQGVQFRYRLLREGREMAPWSDPGPEASITLAGLGAGRYLLEVTASTAAGVEAEEVAGLPFSVRPAFWQTPGFVLLVIVLGILFLVMVSRLRSGALEKERRRLEALVEDRTSELQAANRRLRGEVAERERAEAALLESEGRLRDIIENSTNVFYAHTPEHEITYISPQARKVFGHDPEVFPQVWTTLATDHPANKRGVQVTEEALRTGRRQPPYELQLRHADGHLLWVRVTEAPVLRDGVVVGMVGSLTDVTEARAAEEARQGLEERLREARKMEAVGRLAGGIAHDFNNLLTSILGHTNLMAMELAPDHPLQEDLAEVADACTRAASLVAQLLAVGRRQLMQPMPFHVHAALEERARMLSRVVGDAVDVTTGLEGADPRVVMDPSQFDQVVLNLVLNARDAMPGGGRIELQVSTRELTMPPVGWADPDFEPGDFAELVCSDTGTGMPPEVVERIFEPFFTTKGVGEGTGLGLSTVWGIVRQNRGHVRVTSTPGRGTTFRIWIPANRASGREKGLDPDGV